MIDHCHWDKIWSKIKNDTEFWWWVGREDKGVRNRKIISYIERFLGNISGLKIIEVGSGTGVYSFILSKRGATLTLMDYSKEALLLARKYFSSMGLPANFLYADALNLDLNLREKFDVSMSFGTIEHYRYPEWFFMAQAHLNLVRPGGIVIISVPNSWFLLHEIFKFYLQKRKEWQLGYEKGFSQQELLRLGKKMSLENVEVGGSAFITDVFRYFYIFQGTRFFRKFCSFQFKNFLIRDLSSPFDDLFGADIFLMGRKPFNKIKK